MRTNKHISEIILSLIMNIDYEEIKKISASKDKEALLKYINEEYLNIDDYKNIFSIIKLGKKDILEIIYQLLPLINKDKPEQKDSIQKTKELILKASQHGLTWPNSASCFIKIEEELKELKNAIKQNNNINIKEELGDLLFSILCYADIKKYNVKEILDSSNNKFEKRFNKLKEIAKLKKMDINKASIETREKLWKQAKKEINLSK